MQPDATTAPPSLSPEHVAEIASLLERIITERQKEQASPQSAAPRLLTARDVAARLQTNTQAVYRLTREGKLPAVKLSPRALRWTEDAVSEFITGGGLREQDNAPPSKTLRLIQARG